MKVFKNLSVMGLILLGNSAFADVTNLLECKFATRAQVGEVIVKELGEGKVEVELDFISYISSPDFITTQVLTGVEIKPANNYQSHIKEKHFSLKNEKGEESILVIAEEKIFMPGSSHSRVPCHARVLNADGSCGVGSLPELKTFKKLAFIGPEVKFTASCNGL